MNFASAVAEVAGLTGRPDKLLFIQREINAALNFFCSDTDFPRDVTELTLPITATEYSQVIPFASLPQFRKLQFIKRAGTAEYLTEILPHKLPSLECLVDKYYVAGTGLRINQSKLVANMDIGYYQYPPILIETLGGDAHWLLDASPFMVIDRAASKVFANIGDDASSKTHASASAQAYLAFRSDVKSAL